MQKGDASAANRRFEAVTKLLSEPGLAGRADLNDLTLAATAFTELTRAQMATAASAAVAPAPQPVPPAAASATPPAVSAASTPVMSATTATAPPSTPAASRGAAGAQPPPAARPGAVTTLRAPSAATAPPGFVPAAPDLADPCLRGNPGTGFVAQMGFSGAVRVTIDATGKVTGAVMEPSVYPPYDRQILTAARDWIYRPATQNGKPVTSERLVEIVLRPRTP